MLCCCNAVPANQQRVSQPQFVPHSRICHHGKSALPGVSMLVTCCAPAAVHVCRPQMFERACDAASIYPAPYSTLKWVVAGSTLQVCILVMHAWSLMPSRCVMPLQAPTAGGQAGNEQLMMTQCSSRLLQLRRSGLTCHLNLTLSPFRVAAQAAQQQRAPC